MIKVSFQSINVFDDVCEILEREMTNQKEVEKWIAEKVPTADFDCMDFPYDLDTFYDCYFISNSEEQDAKKIYGLLNQSLSNRGLVEFSVSLVDDKLELIKSVK